MDFAGILTAINTKFGDGFATVDEEAAPETVQVSPSKWGELAPFLRKDDTLSFDAMMCITGIDEGAESENLAVVYNLHSMKQNHKLEVYVSTPRTAPKVPSVEQIWRIADWFERETYDMFGIEFEGHRDLRRILLPSDWEGFPLRKDYQFPDTYRGIVVDKMKEGWE
ncbi:MAG: NADH-quinone oxidoreductase subunit C [Candidatus Marinimicrobia bacterium]|nr:NADH-quinone oxidoreductase subunit C [Candidatus Neomarinimicrobiota bacterium]|tara:strand:- start:3927 stop:4427 length:501 start_codon:yes stop_codon:yes gene_type:complete